ncbi:MAG: MCE family protein [Deltaproteobacteria bacterium]|nr:MCE family protein [Deltaproteobacteria bacterium]
MFRFSTELRVGLLTLFVLAAVAWGIIRTDDKPGESGQPFTLYADFPTAEGVFATTPIRVAGVIVGHVEHLELVGNSARLTLAVLDHVEVPVDSYVALKSEGMLGDKSVRLVLGSSTQLVQPGDTLRTADMPPDMEKVIRQVDAISGDVKAITENVRDITGDEATREELRLTIENIRALSEQLRTIAATNSDDIAIIAANLRDVSEALKQVVEKTGGDVEGQMAQIRTATEKLDATLANVEKITAGIQAGEGTVGKLLKDDSTILAVNDTIGQVNDLVGDVSRIKTEVYYRGDFYFGTEPTDPLLAENPVAGGSRQGMGVRFMPAEDHWYVFELAGHPQGSISSEEHVFPDFGTSYEELVVKPGYRFSFQFARRWNDAVLRFGVKDNAGGLGLDYYLFRDTLMLGVDLFDFAYGSYPVLDGTPNLQANVRFLPWRHLYLEAGFDSVLMGAKYGYVTAYGGGGFYFDDRDIKFILAAVPIKP